MKSTIQRFWRSGPTATARFTLPPVVFEIAPGFASGVVLEGSRRKGRKVGKFALQALSPQSVDPHLSRANIVSAEEFGHATSNLISSVGNSDGRFGLILPDGAMRVTLLSFEALPEHSGEAEALVRWRMRDRLPFNAEEARATYQVLTKSPGHVEILALAMRSSIIAEYQAAFSSQNGGAALILPATVALLPLVPDEDSGAQVLVHVCGDWLTVVVIAGSIPCAWRTRELDPLDRANYEREIASEAARVLASVRDRIQADSVRVWLCARPPGEKNLAAAIADTMGGDVALMRPPSELGSMLAAADRSVFEQFGATIGGLVSNAN